MKFNEAAVREWVAGVLRGIYQPQPDEEIWEWAERTLRIPSTENEELAGTLWSSDYTPYVREIMRWVRRPGKGEFWIKKSSQVGLTMGVLIIICWMIVHRPGNVGYAIDSVEEARKISKTRLQRWIEENRLLEKVNEDADALSNLTYYLRGMTVYLMGAYSKGAWANKSIVLFILDELDKHPYIEGEGTTVTLARERIKRPKNAKIIGFSSPGETDQITLEHARGTQEEIFIPFPCGHMQPLRFENMVFGTAEFKDLAQGYVREKVLSDTYFKCELELCTCRLYDHQKRAALRSYEARATNDKADPRVRSLHVWDAYSPFCTFGDLALEWIDAQGDVTLIERFFRGRRGMKFDKQGKELKHADVLALCRDYEKGICPIVPHLLCQTIDIQGDVVKTVKHAFDAKSNYWVIDWRIFMTLEEAVEWGYDPVMGADGETYFVTHAWIDEGYRAHDVRKICLANMPVFWPVKGLGDVQAGNTIATSEKWCDGEWILRYHIDEGQFKWQLLNLIAKDAKREKNGDFRMHLPKDLDDEDKFVQELTGERPVLQKNKLGKEKWVWEKKGPNDFWDCCKYALALWTLMRPKLMTGGMTAPPAAGEAA